MIMMNKCEYISYKVVAQNVSQTSVAQMSCRLDFCRPNGLSPKRLYNVQFIVQKQISDTYHKIN